MREAGKSALLLTSKTNSVTRALQGAFGVSSRARAAPSTSARLQSTEAVILIAS
jgi:hypothetical protein